MRHEIDGVISDIYFPYDKSGKWSDPNQPVGLGIAVMCKDPRINIPCVLNTAGYHHGTKYQWIHEFKHFLEA